MSDLPDFKKLRFDEAHHLGLGDVRLTIGQQDAIDQRIDALEGQVRRHEKAIDYYRADRNRLSADKARLMAENQLLRDTIRDAYEPGCDCPTCELCRSAATQDNNGI